MGMVTTERLLLPTAYGAADVEAEPMGRRGR